MTPDIILRAPNGDAQRMLDIAHGFIVGFPDRPPRDIVGHVYPDGSAYCVYWTPARAVIVRRSCGPRVAT